ncbi:hypothetical protein EP7_004354 [Isosphaeraceae bacterium EP7]
MNGSGQAPCDQDLAQWLRDTLKQAVEEVERQPDTDEELFVGTLILSEQPSGVQDSGADGFAFTMGGVEYVVRVSARRPGG